MAAHALPLPVLLQVAEHADLETIISFSRTCKAMHKNILEYRHSIAKANLMSRFLLPPLGPVLSSDIVDRVMMKPWTLGTVRDFELREHRISSVMNTSSFLSTWKPESLGITDVAMEKLKLGIKRAICITDRLADIVAHYPEILIGAQAAGRRVRNNKIRGKIRFRQIAIIRSLPTRDLAFLSALTTLAGRGYARYQGPKLESDPDGWEKVISFQEMVLRHGSFSLWAYVRGPKDMDSLVQDYIVNGVDDIREWESANHSFMYDDPEGIYEAADLDDDDASWMCECLPGLHMTLLREFKSRFEEDKDDETKGFSPSDKTNDVVGEVIGETLQI